ncbi:MAG: IclR family transcriptional regulator [Chloroflexi bacterium]|nr:IclR family transcriptional regulator [Chloroflexota bacterium]
MRRQKSAPRRQAYPGTQAVQRAVALLKAFDEARPELGLTALTQAVGLNKATTYRLLTALESEGLVIKSGTGETLRHTRGGLYRLGPELIALGVRALRSSDLRAAARPELVALANETGETVTLEVLAESDVLILDEVFGAHLVGATHWIGTRWHAYATSTGKALLAFLPAQERQRILPARLTALTARTLTSRTALEAELAQIREQGYALANQELEADYSAIGAPVFNHEARVIAAISVGGPQTRMTPECIKRFIPLVKKTAAQISRNLGYVDKLPSEDRVSHKRRRLQRTQAAQRIKK